MSDTPDSDASAIEYVQNRSGREHVAEGPPRSDAPMARWWLLVLPAAIGLTYLVAVALLGRSLLDTGRPGVAGAVAFALLGAFFLSSLFGTLRLYEDARELQDRRAAWRPDPWRYVVGGALALVSYRLVQLLAFGLTVNRPVAYLAGNFVVALVLSSVVSGPVYLLLRHRRLGTP